MSPHAPGERTLALALLAILLPAALAARAGAEPKPIARWLFDEGSGLVAGDGLDGSANGAIERAVWAEGRTGKALAFEDYSLLDYVRPDVSKATRVVVAHREKLNPAGAFTLSATVQPTRDPLFYGGIVEKGRGYGASYRLVLLRGLKVRLTLGSAGDVVTSRTPLSLGSWHEIVATYDGTSLVLAIDGEEAGRRDQVKAAMGSTADLVIGERFSGRIDRVEMTQP
jgi:hypothetical protein